VIAVYDFNTATLARRFARPRAGKIIRTFGTDALQNRLL